MALDYDLGGNTIICESLKTGATGPNQSGTAAAISSTELAVLDAASNANSGTGKAVITGTSGALTIPGVLTNAGGYTSTAGITTKSGTAVPATAGAVAAGAPITCFSSGWKLWVTSDVPSHTATKGDLCINTGGSSSSTRLYVNNGTTTWIAITTAS